MARWSDIGKWVGPTKNSGDGDKNEHETADRMTGHDGVVLHIAAGYYQGTIAWQRNPAAKVSSHFIVGKTAADPTVQMVDTDDRSWAQRDGNSRWLSIEFAGWVGEKLTAYQLEQAARILAKAHQVYGVPLQVTNSPKTRGLGHHSMGAENGLNWGHSACPGAPIKAQKAAIVARAKQIINGVPPAKEPDVDLDDKIDPDGTLSGYNQRTLKLAVNDQVNERAVWWGKQSEIPKDHRPDPDAPIMQVIGLPAKLDALAAKVDQLAATPPGTVVIDKADLIEAVREVLREGVGTNPVS